MTLLLVNRPAQVSYAKRKCISLKRTSPLSSDTFGQNNTLHEGDLSQSLGCMLADFVLSVPYKNKDDKGQRRNRTGVRE